MIVTAPGGWLRRGLRQIAAAGGAGGGAMAAARRNLLRQIRQREALAAAPLPARILAARRRLLAGILARREFTAQSRRTVAEAIRGQIAAWMAALRRRLLADLPSGRSGGWALLAAVIAAALGMLALAAWRWWRGRPAKGGETGGPAADAAEDAAAWLRRARREAAAGDDAAAALDGYEAGLRFGAAAGWWQLRAASTAREYLQRLPAGHSAWSNWRELTAALERWRYAGQGGAAAAARAVLRALEGLGCR